MQRGRKGMGTRKHAVSGYAWKNRRAMKEAANLAQASGPKKKSKMYASIRDLMEERR